MKQLHLIFNLSIALHWDERLYLILEKNVQTFLKNSRCEGPSLQGKPWDGTRDAHALYN